MPISMACEVTLRMRVRNSRSKPFITDSTTTSVATPSVRPMMEISATNETKPRRCVERRWRVPMSSSYAATLLVPQRFGRLDPRGAQRRVDRGKAGEQEGTEGDRGHHRPAHVGWQRGHVVH